MSDEPRIVYPAASFQPPDSCPECADGVPFDATGQHTTEHQAAETPWEDLRRMALVDYEAVTTVAHSWSSVVPRAINFYFDNAPDKRNPNTEHQRLKDAALEALHEWRDGFIETEELFAAHDALLAFESTEKEG